jgi:hypothetical protein
MELNAKLHLAVVKTEDLPRANLIGVKLPKTTNTGTSMLEFRPSPCVDPKAENPKNVPLSLTAMPFGTQT